MAGMLNNDYKNVRDNKDKYEYSKFISIMYNKGYYVTRYNIDIMSDEISCNANKIFIKPEVSNNEITNYVFTGSLQKENTITEYRLFIEDENGEEFDASDNIRLILVDKDNSYSISRRHYCFWKAGLQFDRGTLLNSDRYMILEANKNIGRFDIRIDNIDLFRKKLKDKKTKRKIKKQRER